MDFPLIATAGASCSDLISRLIAPIYHDVRGARSPRITEYALRATKDLVPLLLLPLLLLVACGEPTDREQDCTVNEYFDEGDRLCTSCPALLEPSCREGCGFRITSDALGCPQAECDLSCSLCAQETAWSRETLSCEPRACGVGEFQDPEDGSCSACPAQDDVPTDCAAGPCTDCQFVSLPDELGCPVLTCALCTAPPDMSAGVDDVGRCILP